MKKKLLAVLAMVCILLMAGCMNSSPSPEDGGNPSSSSVSQGEESTPAEEIQENEAQDKASLLESLFADRENLKQDENCVFTSDHGTERISLVKQCLDNVQEDKSAHFVGYLTGGTVPIAYEFSYTSGGQAQLFTYSGHLGFKEYAVTDIYEHPLFYHFTDHETLFFSIPKSDFVYASKTSIEGYAAGKDLKSDGVTPNPLTAQQAMDAALETDGALEAYQKETNQSGYPLHGILIPSSIEPVGVEEKSAQILDAVWINEARYYKIAVSQAGEDISANPSNIYYVAADDTDATTIFLESMVAGELTPAGYQKGIQHISLKE